MSDLPPPPGPTPTRTRRRQGARLAVMGALAATVVLVVALGAWATLTGSDTGPATADGEASAVGAPTGWDPRIDPLVAFVAEARGRPFLAPVTVEFLDEAAFLAAVEASEGEGTDEDRASLDLVAAQLGALGLVDTDLDIAAATRQLVRDGALAFYDTDDDVIRVRGTELDAARRVTVVHELTHAWQDQHLDLSRLDTYDDARASVLRVLGEGDATFVENRYVASLGQADQQAIERQRAALADRAAVDVAAVPVVLQALFASPYVIGAPFVVMLDADGGTVAIDDALVDPPAAEVALLSPARFFEGVEPVAVTAGGLPPGAEQLGDDEFGALGLYLALADRLDPRVALDAVDGWAGDRVLTYRQAGRACVAIGVRGVDAPATGRLAAAFQSWVAAGPAGEASVQTVDDRPVLQSCEPDGGPGVEPGSSAATALQYVALRLTVFEQILTQTGADVARAACFADTVVDQIPPEELASGQPVSAEEGQRRGTRAAVDCLS